MFHVRENKANYVLDGTDETMLFKICDAENGKAICRKNKNGSTLLIPNKNMELDELNFMCKQVNIYWTYHKELPKTVKCFEDKSVYKCIDEYVWELFPRIDFLFLPQTKSKINKIVKVLVILLVSTLLTLLFLDEFFNCSIFADISNWLFE